MRVYGVRWRTTPNGPLPTGTRDVAGQPRAIPRLHEHQGVFGDGVLRIGHGAGPQRVRLLHDERRGAAHETNPPAGRLAPREHHSRERVPVPGGVDRLIAAAAEHHRVGPRRDLGDLEDRLSGAPADRAHARPESPWRSARTPCAATPRSPGAPSSRSPGTRPSRPSPPCASVLKFAEDSVRKNSRTASVSNR